MRKNKTGKIAKRAGAAVLTAALACGMSCPVGVQAAGRETRLHRAERTVGVAVGSFGLASVAAGIAPIGVGAAGENENGATDAKALARFSISVGDGQETPTYKAGEKAKLQIYVMNKGNVDLRNVKISPVIEKAEEWLFEMDQLNYDIELGDLAAGEKKAAVWGGTDESKGKESGGSQSVQPDSGSAQAGSGAGSLTVRSDVTGKSYRLNFHITFDDGEKEYQTDKYVFVHTKAKDEDQKDGQADDQKKGETLGGSGSQEGSGADGNRADGNRTNENGVNESGANESGANGNSVNGNDAVINSGNDGSAVEQMETVYNYSGGASYEPTGSGESGSQSIPRVIVTGFDTEPAEVKAGNNFKLIIHLRNTSSRTAVSNMLFDLQAPTSGSDAAAEAPAFLPASGSSSIYLEAIPAGGTSDIAIDLNARADLIQKPYSITMSMKYEDKAATQYEAVSNLAIPIRQDVRFETSKIEVNPQNVMAGDEVNLTCSIYNLGRVKMHNVKVKIEGDAIDSQEQFIGNLDSGGTGYVDVILTASAASMEEENCRLIVSYEDDAGNVTTQEQKFTLQIEEPIDFEEMNGLIETEPEENSPISTVVVVTGVGVVAVAAIVAVILLKKRKKNAQLAKEEDLLDEVERLTENEHEQP